MRTIVVNGQVYLYFGGTSYLGMHSEPRFMELLLSNIRTYGFHHGASRLSNLRLPVYDYAERHLANWVGSPEALTVSSGFLAGQLVSTHFNNNAFKIFTAPNAHAAMGCPGNARFGSFGALNKAVQDHLTGNGKAVPVLFMDSVDFSGESYPGYEAIQSLPLEHVILVADDSHGLGILGDGGLGTYKALEGLASRELLVCGSLGKAMELQGGFVLGTSGRLGKLRESSIYAGASPAPPAHMACLAAAASLYSERHKALMAKVSLFENECRCLHRLSHMKAYPVYCFEDHALTSFLMASGIFVTYFRYPSAQDGTLPGRIVLSAHHRDEDIRFLADLLNAYHAV